MYEIFICDDDAAFAAELSSMLSRAFEKRGDQCHVTLYPDPARVLSALKRGARCDLLFQDILFGEERGIRFGKLLREQNWDIDLVFVTSSQQYAVAGYDAQPLHFLLKPLEEERLAEVLDRFLARRAVNILSLATPQGTARLPLSDVQARLPLSDVLFFEVYNHVVELRRRDGSESSWRGSLQVLERQLPAGRFVRIHRSYLVNLEHIAVIGRDRLRLSSGDIIPMSRADYASIQPGLAAFDRRRHPSG